MNVLLRTDRLMADAPRTQMASEPAVLVNGDSALPTKRPPEMVTPVVLRTSNIGVWLTVCVTVAPLKISVLPVWTVSVPLMV